jgi:hypothetical protein
MYFFGPYAPGTTGTSSTIKTSAASGSVAISKYGAAAVTSQNGMKFSQDLETIHSFDLGQFQAILGGTATAFKTQVDTCGSNVLSVVVEVPKSNVRYSKYFECGQKLRKQ